MSKIIKTLFAISFVFICANALAVIPGIKYCTLGNTCSLPIFKYNATDKQYFWGTIRYVLSTNDVPGKFQCTLVKLQVTNPIFNPVLVDTISTGTRYYVKMNPNRLGFAKAGQSGQFEIYIQPRLESSVGNLDGAIQISVNNNFVTDLNSDIEVNCSKIN